MTPDRGSFYRIGIAVALAGATVGWSYFPRFRPVEAWTMAPRVVTAGSGRVDLGPPLVLAVGPAPGTAAVWLQHEAVPYVEVESSFTATIRGEGYAQAGALGRRDDGEEMWFAPHQAVGTYGSGDLHGRASFAAPPGAATMSAFAHLRGADARMEVTDLRAATVTPSPLWQLGTGVLSVAWIAWTGWLLRDVWRAGQRWIAVIGGLFAVGLVIPAVWKNDWKWRFGVRWPLDPLLSPEKLAHLGFFALLGATLGPRAGPWPLLGVAFCTEILQLLTIDRDPTWTDLGFDAIGLAVGLALARVIRGRPPPSEGR